MFAVVHLTFQKFIISEDIYQNHNVPKNLQMLYCYRTLSKRMRRYGCI